jgi:hypothetical protein
LGFGDLGAEVEGGGELRGERDEGVAIGVRGGFDSVEGGETTGF